MELQIRTRSYNSYGGTPEFRVIEALFDQVGTTFGSAVTEIDFLICLASRPGTPPLPSLEGMFEDYHRWLTGLPLRTYRRSKGLIEISATVDFLHAQDLVPEEEAEFRAIMGRYFYERQLSVCDLLISELAACKKRFKSSDDFDHSAFMDWARSLPSRIPTEKQGADELAAGLDKRRRQRYERLSPWEKLDIDWEEFHLRAKDLVPDHRLWSVIDDLSPHGNDTGSDVLTLVQENASALGSGSDEGRGFYRATWEGWGFSWPPELQPSDEVEYNTHREFVVGLAFAFLKVIGQCPPWLRASALNETERYREFLEHRHKSWEHLQEAIAMQALMHSILANEALAS